MATFTVDPLLYGSTGGVLPWPTPSPLNQFAFLRDALNTAKSTAGSGHLVSLSEGSFDIRKYSVATTITQTINGKKVRVQTGWKLATNGAPTLARFGAKSLTIAGASDAGGVPTTVITNLNRIYTGQSDRGYGIPQGWTLRNLILRFSGGSGYILQAGEYGLDTSTEIDNLTFENVVFEGTHTGAVGGNGSLPWGIYLDIRSGSPNGVPDHLGLTLDRVKVTLTGQGGLGAGQFIPANLPYTGGSAFLSAQGDKITIANSVFDESGYRNALTIANSTNVVITGNTFTRSSSYGNRYTGEKLVNVGGSIEGNKFEHGSYLEFYDAYRPVKVADNVFDLSQSGGYSIMFRDNVTAGYSLAVSGNIDLSSNVFRGGLVAKSELAIPSQLVLGSKSGATNSVEIGSASYVFDRFLVGGQADDQLGGIGSEEADDWISGDFGNDTLTGNGGDDAFVFATTLDPANNVDTVTDFGVGDKIWLDDAIFSSGFAGITQTNNGGNLELRFSGTLFATLSGLGATPLLETDFVVF